MKPLAPSAVGTSVFRELSGPEAAAVFAHDLEEAIIKLLATDEFKDRAEFMLLRSGRFGSGACFPVVEMTGQIKIKVYASVESARSKERLPEPWVQDIDVKTGEVPNGAEPMLPDNSPVAVATMKVDRKIGVDIPTSVDKVRTEAGIAPMVPQRDNNGTIVNTPIGGVKKLTHAERLAKAREAKKKRQEEMKKAEMDAAARERLAQEQEARGDGGDAA